MDGPFGSDATSFLWLYRDHEGEPVAANLGSRSNIGRDFSYDGKRQRGCFVRDADIWCALWTAERGWHDAAPLPAPVNTPGYEASPHFAPDGSLYFASMREGGPGEGDIYRAVQTGDGWHVSALGPAINSPTGEWNLALSPDGAVLVFEASGRPANRTPSGDLYLSCRTSRGWSEAAAMEQLNTDDSDLDFRFHGARSGTFTTATIGGDGRLRHAGPEHFARCR
ncbi:hypothetical protein [Qipengyuania nanhaisediminis]|uniref:hypothetical protein n=1 Tax=Qipengyuania nanhaisediminis TaxID=604088 RepID=UPI0038B298D1